MKKALTPGRIPLKNLRAHPVRTVILLLLTLAQAACVFGGLTMVQAMQGELTTAMARLGADILLYPSAAMSRISGKTLLMQGSPVEVWKDRSLLLKMQNCNGIEKVSCQLYIRDTTQETPVWIVGFDPSSDFVISPWTKNGDVSSLPDGAVLAGCRVSPDQDTVCLFGRDWPVAARLEKTESDLDERVYVSLSTLRQLITVAESAGVTSCRSVDPQNDFSAALIKVRSGADVDSVTGWLNVYLRKVKAVRSEETLTDTSSGIRGQILLITAVAAAAWILLLLALGAVQSLMMKERKRELYLWYAIGADRSFVLREMLTEALLIHIPGAVSGVILSWAVLRILQNAPFSVFCALITVTLTAAAGCVSTAAAVRRTVGALNGQMLLSM